MDLYPPLKTNSQAEPDFGKIVSLAYHEIFGYPLTRLELIKWYPGERALKINVRPRQIKYGNGFYFLEGKSEIILRRLFCKKESIRKLKIAQKAALTLGKIPTIKMVGLTGSLAMQNSDYDSDIDLMIITKKGTLWTTRMIVYFVLRIMNYDLRKFGQKSQKDKLCLNLWMDEGNLHIQKHSIYTAHEIAQIKPLVNEDRTYERLISKNKWVRSYWPNAVKPKKIKGYKMQFSVLSLFEPVAFFLQKIYMFRKRTNEFVAYNRAFFHPFDWGEKVISLLTLDPLDK